MAKRITTFTMGKYAVKYGAGPERFGPNVTYPDRFIPDVERVIDIIPKTKPQMSGAPFETAKLHRLHLVFGGVWFERMKLKSKSKSFKYKFAWEGPSALGVDVYALLPPEDFAPLQYMFQTEKPWTFSIAFNSGKTGKVTGLNFWSGKEPAGEGGRDLTG